MYMCVFITFSEISMKYHFGFMQGERSENLIPFKKIFVYCEVLVLTFFNYTL